MPALSSVTEMDHQGTVASSFLVVMALDQLKAFILTMQDDDALKQTVLAASTADDVAKIAKTLPKPC